MLFCRALRCLLTARNRSVSAEKRCGSGVSTPFTPMVSTYRKGMTNFPFFSFYLFLHRHLYIYFTFVLLLSLFVGFVLHPLSDSLLFTNLIISSSSQRLYSYSLCPVPGPVPDSAFYIFFFCQSGGRRFKPRSSQFFIVHPNLSNSSSFVFISHLTNFLSYSVFMHNM